MSAGRAAAAYIDKLLGEARTREGSLETRAAALLTATLAIGSGLVTVLGFLVNRKFTIPGPARFVVVAGVALFAACVSGLLAAAPRRRQEADPASLAPLVADEHWNASEDQALKQFARAQLRTFAGAQAIVDRKGKWLRGAFALAVAGLFALGAALLMSILAR